MGHKAPQIHYKAVSAVKNCAYDFTEELDDSEGLTGTPTVTATGLTIDNVRINNAAVTIDGVTVAAGKAVLWRVAGGTANTTYVQDIQASTDASPAQTLRGEATLIVEAD